MSESEAPTPAAPAQKHGHGNGNHYPWAKQQPGEGDDDYLLRMQVKAAYARECLAKKYARKANKYAVAEMLETCAYFVFLRINKMRQKKLITWTQADETHLLEMVRELVNVTRRIDDHHESKRTVRKLPSLKNALKDSDPEEEKPAQSSFVPGRAIKPAPGTVPPPPDPAG